MNKVDFIRIEYRRRQILLIGSLTQSVNINRKQIFLNKNVIFMKKTTETYFEAIV